ncbi:hypothetical protein [Escherichia coli]
MCFSRSVELHGFVE